MEALHTESCEIALIHPLCDCVDGRGEETPGPNSLCGGRKKVRAVKNIPTNKKSHLQVDFFVCEVLFFLPYLAELCRALIKTRADLHNRTCFFSSVQEDIRLELHIPAVSTRGQFSILVPWTVSAVAVNTSLIPT